MGGGLMQLVAYGAQDVYLTGNPQITFFKVVYRRHTNFAMESIEQTFNGDAQVGSRASCTISRNGDLIHKMWLRAVVPQTTITMTADGINLDSTSATVHFAKKMGLALIKNIELEIGGQRIDKHYGDWMNIWNELSLPESKREGYSKLVGDGDENTDARLDHMSFAGFNAGAGMTQGANDGVIPEFELNVPVEFWFCRNPGLALPLIALQYHEVKVNVELNSGRHLGMISASVTADNVGATGSDQVATVQVGANSQTVTIASGVATTETDSARVLFNDNLVKLSSCSLWVDYVYLDTDERRRFAQTSHEYLIEQLQENSVSVAAVNSTVKLTFNHPVKELVWVAQPENNLLESAYAGDNQAITSADVNLSHGQFAYQFFTNGNDTTQETTWVANLGSGNPVYPVNPVVSAKLMLNGHDRFEERTGEYFNLVQPFQHHTRVPKDQGINVYSFALKPEEHQPSGTCNMSRIDVADLRLQLRNSDNHLVRVYATNYNVLRIMSGMGGLAFAN